MPYNTRRLVLVAVLASSAVPAAAQEPIVDGFRGHPWGSRVEDIPELAGNEQVGEREGLRIYSTEARLLGRQALAGYYFHPDTGELVEGAYVMVMPLESCQTIWDLLSRDIQRTFPGLERQGELPSRRNAHRPVYESTASTSSITITGRNGAWGSETLTLRMTKFACGFA